MRELILKMSITIDGFVAGTNRELDWTAELDEAAEEWTLESVSGAGVHLVGSRTYYDMASYWPYSKHAFAAPMNEIPKVVFSAKGHVEQPQVGNVADEVLESWMNPRVLSDLVPDVMKLKSEEGKPIIAHGGATFAQSLVKYALVDEYQLLVHPVAIGTGMALFSRIEQPLKLDLVDAKVLGSGVAHVYRPKR